MSDKIIELLMNLETLNDEELKQISIWVDFNLTKRKNISTKENHL